MLSLSLSLSARRRALARSRRRLSTPREETKTTTKIAPTPAKRLTAARELGDNDLSRKKLSRAEEDDDDVDDSPTVVFLPHSRYSFSLPATMKLRRELSECFKALSASA